MRRNDATKLREQFKKQRQNNLEEIIVKETKEVEFDKEELINRRISLAYDARETVQSDWGKGYWDAVLAYLLRQANRLN